MAHNEAYYEAEKKIEEALKSGATELRLKGMELTELPESIEQLTQLQWLDISLCHLTALPKTLGQLTQLRLLDLANNQLTTLPEFLGQLTQLRLLILSYNKITALPESIGTHVLEYFIFVQ